MKQRILLLLSSLSLLVSLAGLAGCHDSNHTFGGAAAPTTNAALARLSISAGALDQVFDPTRGHYTLAVPNAVMATTVTATTAAARASVVVDGVAVPSGMPSAKITLAEGKNTIMVDVTAEDGMHTQRYQVDVTRLADATLRSLTLSAGSLDQAFDPTLLDYTARVAFINATTTISAHCPLVRSGESASMATRSTFQERRRQ